MIMHIKRLMYVIYLFITPNGLSQMNDAIDEPYK
jgi:hypothetical protein